MRAFIVDRYGKNDNELRAGDVPEPTIGAHDVLVQVHAAGVNALDSKIRDGEFKLFLPYRPPFVLGNDVAGVVTRAGARVREFKPGDEVYARPGKNRIGTFAEFIAVHEDDLARKPKRLTMEEAASLPLVGLTAWQALIERAHLRKGQKVFIQAGSGGVGTFAIQLAKHLGATVATTTSTANAGLVERLGADTVIDYRKDDFETVLHDYDVVLHSLDNETLKKSLRVLKPGGKLISLSGPPDPDFAREMGKPWILRPATRVLSHAIRTAAKHRQVDYSFLFMRASGTQLREITSLIDDGAIEPVVDRVFPFESTNEAMAYVDEGHVKGKAVVKVRRTEVP
ncbi:NADP-dependent oxidoreductase [Amycolatopsis mediterranei]|uniref:NADP-dependent oxidoreductase n=1 Tax=Amycolatopsis mediterranei TaxID=33910 RepID=UPI00343477EC